MALPPHRRECPLGFARRKSQGNVWYPRNADEVGAAVACQDTRGGSSLAEEPFLHRRTTIYQAWQKRIRRLGSSRGSRPIQDQQSSVAGHLPHGRWSTVARNCLPRDYARVRWNFPLSSHPRWKIVELSTRKARPMKLSIPPYFSTEECKVDV